MVKALKMELLRALINERLSTAAEEIFKIVERSMMEYEKEMSCSKWVVDSHRRLLDVATSQSENSLQTSVPDVKLHSGLQLPAASGNENTRSQSTQLCPNLNNTHPDSPASPNEQQIPTDAKQEDDHPQSSVKILKRKKPFKCPVCLSGFSSNKTMVQHVKKHPEDNSSLYQCQLCERCFSFRSEFIIHTRTHRGSRPYKCQWRGRSPQLSHTVEKPYQCSSEKVEAEEAQLRSVTPTRKAEELDIFRTFPLAVTPNDKSEFDQESLQPLCLYQIQRVADIDKVTVDHIEAEPAGADGGVSDRTTHDHEQGEGQTESRITNVPLRRSSGKSSELMVQFEAGTAQKPYKCPRCTKCFSLTKTLIRHIRIHTEDKPYQCQVCGRNFCQKSDLVNHTRIHTGERPYQCQECHKLFAQKGNLVVHMRKHMADKPSQTGMSSDQTSVLSVTLSERCLTNQVKH